jgi:heme A synthase
LGALTVLLGLSVAASTIHLVNANVIFAGLILLASVSTWGERTQLVESPKLKRLAISGMAALLIQLCLGALVRHGHAGLACPNFPNCLSGFFPIPFTPQTCVAFVHRWWGVLLLGVFVHIRIATTRLNVPTLSRLGSLLMSFSVFQVALGIYTVKESLETHARATHAAVGYGLWAVLVAIAIRSGAFRSLWDPSRAKSGAQLSRAATAGE